MPDLFLGDWRLLPELSLYAQGAPPASGIYTIREGSAGLELSLRWTAEPGGPEMAMAFGGPPDGSVQPFVPVHSAPAGAPDGLRITRVDARTLDSEALLGEQVVAYARRVASEDGSLLAVLMEHRHADGRHVRNFQVYRRA